MMRFGMSGLTVPRRIPFRTSSERSVSSLGTSKVAVSKKLLNVSLMNISIRAGRSLSRLFCSERNLIVFFCIQNIQSSASLVTIALAPNMWRSMVCQAVALSSRKWIDRTGRMTFLLRFSLSFSVSVRPFASSCWSLAISMCSRPDPLRVDGKLMKQQLSGWPPS